MLTAYIQKSHLNAVTCSYGHETRMERELGTRIDSLTASSFMEQLSPPPTPEEVLNKLKSDGTFDQLRRSCLAAIEAEVIVYTEITSNYAITAALSSCSRHSAL